MRVRQFPILLLVFLSLAFFVPVGAAHADDGTLLIKRLNDTLLATMQSAKQLGYEGRYKKLEPVIASTFDLDFMAQYAAGAPWRKLNASQRKGLIDAFSQLTIATYANRFNGYSGETFRILSEETPRKGNRLVYSELVKSDGEAIKLNYLLRQTKDGWRVIDIFLKGKISELATKRSEYSSALTNEGFDGLMAIFERKIAGLTAAKG